MGLRPLFETYVNVASKFITCAVSLLFDRPVLGYGGLFYFLPVSQVTIYKNKGFTNFFQKLCLYWILQSSFAIDLPLYVHIILNKYNSSDGKFATSQGRFFFCWPI